MWARMARTARRLEAMADAGDLTGAGELCAHLQETIQRFGPALRGLSKRRQTPQEGAT